MCKTDAYTLVGNFRRGLETTEAITTLRMDHFYDNPKKLIADSKKATKDYVKSHQYCEVVLDRYSGNQEQFGGRLQPSEIVVFVDDPSKIGDLQKKHAAYFGVPIIMIDPKKHG